jgi:hypothetical protein
MVLLFLVASGWLLAAAGVATADNYTVQVEADYSPNPIPGPVEVGTPTDIDLTAWVLDPPSNSNPYTCEIQGPFWTRDPITNSPDSWSIVVQYSQTDPNSLGTPPSGSYSYSVNQGSVSSADAALSFTANVEGYWSITASAQVYYNNGSCGDQWLGMKSPPPIKLTFNPLGDQLFDLEGKPDSDIALRNEYVAQILNCEVLKGWKVRYTAPPVNTNVTWWYKPGGVDTQFGAGNPFERTENTVGTWTTIYFKSTQFPNGSAPRTVVVGDVTSPAGAPGFDLQAGGNYTKAGFVVNSPAGAAITMSGEVDLAGGSPALTKFKWGFIQGVQAVRNTTYTANAITWNAASPNGATLTFPTDMSVKNIPAPPPLINDAPINHQLYGDTNPVALGTAGTAQDRPENAASPLSLPMRDTAMNNSPVSYQILANQNQSWTFTVWVTVFNTETNQYVPLRQRGWTLSWDTTAAGPWVAAPGAEVPAGSLTKPSDAEDTILIDGRMQKNTVDPFNIATFGADKTRAKPDQP